MNTSVDVLAVMDGLSSLWRDESKIVGRWDSADELDSIRAAVAELIEAIEVDLRGEEFNSQDQKWTDYSKRRRQERNRVANALASVKGA